MSITITDTKTTKTLAAKNDPSRAPFASVDYDELRAFRAERKSYQTKLILPGTPALLWPYLSDTDAAERRAGFAAPELEYRVLGGGRFLTGASKLAGSTLRFTELPFEWEFERYHMLERIFASGPFRYFSGRNDLRALDDNRTELTITFYYVPRYRWLPTGKMVQALVGKIATTIKEIVAEIPEQAKAPEDRFGFAARRETGTIRNQIDELAGDWGRDLGDADLGRLMADFVLTRDENVLRRMRPLELAAHFDLDGTELLRFCLESVKQGYLEIQWDVLCPVCRGTAGRRTGLAELSQESHCDSCNIRYDAAFDENVEVTFRPAARIQELQDVPFCPAAPSTAKHVTSQFFLLPGDERSEPLPRQPGRYRLRHDNNQDTQELRVADASELRVRNDSDRILVVKLEREEDRTFVTTAQRVTAMQEFRDRFGSEVLRPGVHMAVKKIALLFTDLKGSTRLYEREGDARALAIVQDHFEDMARIIARNGGAVVKTIGDAVMAVFLTPAAGFRAAREIQEAFQDYSARGTEITLKLGLHSGPALALNRNDILDYFGTTVNRAARLESHSRGGDIVFSEEIFEDPEVRAQLKRDNDSIQIKRFRSTLKGFQEESTLYRVEPKTSAAALSA